MGLPTVTVGILALQGDVREHEVAFGEVGVSTRRVLRPADLEGIGGIVLPGGESTTVSMLLVSSGLMEPLSSAVRGGLPTFGTCAGLILLASSVEDGRPDQWSLGALDCAVRRNGYGPQRFSFETSVDPCRDDLTPDDGPLPAIFIRAPIVTCVGSDVRVLATEGTGGDRAPVVISQGSVLAATFHPELTSDRRVQRLFVRMATKS